MHNYLNMHLFADSILVIVLSPEDPEITSVADEIRDANVTCNEKEKLQLNEAMINLDKLILKAEAVLGRLLYALDNAIGTRALPMIVGQTE